MDNCDYLYKTSGKYFGTTYIDEIVRSADRDIDLHRYQCEKCKRIGYYSQAARDFYEDGITCNITGLTGE